MPPPVDSKMTCMAARPRERLPRLRLGVFETMPLIQPLPSAAPLAMAVVLKSGQFRPATQLCQMQCRHALLVGWRLQVLPAETAGRLLEKKRR